MSPIQASGRLSLRPQSGLRNGLRGHFSWETSSMEQEVGPSNNFNAAGIEMTTPQEMHRLVEAFDWATSM